MEINSRFATINSVNRSSRKRSERYRVERAKARGRRKTPTPAIPRWSRRAGASPNGVTQSGAGDRSVALVPLERKIERRSEREVMSPSPRFPALVLGRAARRNRGREKPCAPRLGCECPRGSISRPRLATPDGGLRQALAAARLPHGLGLTFRVRRSRFFPRSPATTDVQVPAQSGACRSPQESAPRSRAPVRRWSSSKPMSGIFSRTLNPSGVTSITAMSV